MDNKKIVGIIGAILYIIYTPLPPGIGVIVMITGLIMVGLAFYSYMDTETTFNAYVKGASLVALSELLTVIMSVLTPSLVKPFMRMEINPGNLSLAAILLAIIFYVLSLIGSIYLNKSLNQLGKSLENKSFKIAGKLIFWGALTSIILIGVYIYFVGKVFLLIGFLTLKTNNIREGSIEP